MKKLILMTILAGLLAAPALANPSFGDGGAALQGVLDGIATDGTSDVKAATDALADIADSYWSIDGSGGSVTTMIIEIASYAGTNKFGVYNNGQYVELFDGSATAGAQVTLSIDALGNVYIDHVANGVTFSGTSFGYYLDATEGNNNDDAVFHSDTDLNLDDFDHMAAYQGIGEEVQIAQWAAGPWTNNMYVLAFEDIYGGGDKDFTDMVVMVESVGPVIPAPGAVVLGSIGVAFVGWLRRRRTL